VHVVAIFASIPEGSQIEARWVKGGGLVGTSYTDPQPQQANAHLIFSGHNIGWGHWRVDIVDGSSVLASVEFVVSGYGGPMPSAHFITHVVKEGDTLKSILLAHTHSVGYPQIHRMKSVLELNDLQSENHIYVGQVLRILWGKTHSLCRPLPFPIPEFL
jgi:hypothetical protein